MGNEIVTFKTDLSGLKNPYKDTQEYLSGQVALMDKEDQRKADLAREAARITEARNYAKSQREQEHAWQLEQTAKNREYTLKQQKLQDDKNLKLYQEKVKNEQIRYDKRFKEKQAYDDTVYTRQQAPIVADRKFLETYTATPYTVDHKARNKMGADLFKQYGSGEGNWYDRVDSDGKVIPQKEGESYNQYIKRTKDAKFKNADFVTRFDEATGYGGGDSMFRRTDQLSRINAAFKGNEGSNEALKMKTKATDTVGAFKMALKKAVQTTGAAYQQALADAGTSSATLLAKAKKGVEGAIIDFGLDEKKGVKLDDETKAQVHNIAAQYNLSSGQVSKLLKNNTSDTGGIMGMGAHRAFDVKKFEEAAKEIGLGTGTFKNVTKSAKEAYRQKQQADIELKNWEYRQLHNYRKKNYDKVSGVFKTWDDGLRTEATKALGGVPVGRFQVPSKGIDFTQAQTNYPAKAEFFKAKELERHQQVNTRIQQLDAYLRAYPKDKRAKQQLKYLRELNL